MQQAQRDCSDKFQWPLGKEGLQPERGDTFERSYLLFTRTTEIIVMAKNVPDPENKQLHLKSAHDILRYAIAFNELTRCIHERK